MTTECNTREFNFQALGRLEVTARFDGGAITSDAGGLLLREVEAKTGIIRRLAACFDCCGPGLADSWGRRTICRKPQLLGNRVRQHLNLVRTHFLDSEIGVNDTVVLDA